MTTEHSEVNTKVLKDLSRQLCELAGIEAKYQYKGLNLPLFKCREDIKEFFNKHEHNLKSRNIEFKEENIKEETVDFELPENFVKLFNVIAKTDFLTWDYSSYAKSIESSSDFIYEVKLWIEEITSDEDWQELSQVIKQALQTQDWSY